MPLSDTTIFKDMKKAICITPADNKMELVVRAISILNQYKISGFKTKKAFMVAVMGENPSYDNFEGSKRLDAFWEGRLRDLAIINDLEVILEKLKLS